MKQYRVLVKGGRPIAGYRADGGRVRVMPREYDCYWLSIARGQDPTLRAALRLIGADSLGGDLDVMKDEFSDDLDGFPELKSDSKFEVLN
ncbi:hypothetical protein FHW67_002728 [Herbaspirillum sp. Sphag1AN]|uniref:hypothetical protein n=1 Tax=unclassified Herbaspirillum TaxID=2624150 RepID=UPI00160A0628|nr:MULTISPECIES: hypothetical protein [unclassified Herbaspirillum]MBB3213436.1 hypothetical protein [Herbaspirillum sp. Sphag1AN]MBB3246520.1 hypothetical protein [Herbaspirillum sp. Sphag64]